MLNAFLVKLLEVVLNWLTSRVTKEVNTIVTEKIEEKQAEVTNAANVVKYEKAKSRIERIKAAEDLLNRTRN